MNIFRCSILFVFFVAVLLAACLGSDVENPNFDQTTDSTVNDIAIDDIVDEAAIPHSDSVGDLENSKKTAKFYNLIAYQKVLFGSIAPPPTSIDLAIVFENHEDFIGSEPVYEIEDYGDTKVVEPKLEGDSLVFTWKGVGVSDVTLLITNPVTGVSVHDRVKLEAWAPNYFTMFFTVIGGLGIFLLGMKYMSEGLQTVAGSSLRWMIATVTDNRFFAVMVGLITTMLIQSSTVTTIMVVGFVNSQIMTLSQAIGVIMGANIGTTATGWILALDVGKYGLPILGFAGFVYLFSKSDRVRFIAMSFMGFGFIFFGLQLMQGGFSVLRDLPAFAEWMKTFSASTYFGVLKCVGIGCVMTLVLQSSAATLAITMSLAAIGVIQFETAAALVLGENIGTTFTAVLASINATTNAKRAAYFHVIFNVCGVVWATLFFLSVFVPTVYAIVGVNELGEIRDIVKGIALTHTLFNVTNTILFLPFIGFFAKFLMRLVPDKDEAEKKPHLTSLHTRLLETSALSVEQSRVEIIRMSKDCGELAQWVEEIFKSDTLDENLVEQAFHQEEVLDKLQDEVMEFMADLLSGNISHEVAEIARGQLRMADELESISDYLIVILKSMLKLRQSNLTLPEPVRTQIYDLHDCIESHMLMIHKFYAMRKHGMELLTEVNTQGRSITIRVKTIREQFLKMMSDERYDPQLIMAVNTQLNAYRRVREHAQNVAEAIVGVK